MSYLGGSIAYLWNQVQLWTGRANSAWGSSRVWNSGTSFESDSGTWHTRANTAYDSGTWGTGNTWQTDYNNEVTLYNNEVTAYNRDTPSSSLLTASAGITGNGAGGAAAQIALSSFSAGTLGATQSGNTLVLPKSGYYMVKVIARAHGDGNSWQIGWRYDGVLQDSQAITVQNGGGDFNHVASTTNPVLLTAGHTIDVYGNNYPFGDGGCGLYVTFVPVLAYPH